MDLSLERPEGYLFVRRVAPDAITVVDRTLTRSFALGVERVIEDWPVGDAAAITPEHMEALLELEPEVVLLGTGARQSFPPAAAMAALLRRGVGIEVMDNAAAARTHAVLASEGRRVVAAFILGGD
jgi:uncharacterized protein